MYVCTLISCVSVHRYVKTCMWKTEVASIKKSINKLKNIGNSQTDNI